MILDNYTQGTAATMLVGAFAGLYLMSKAVVYADPEGRRPFVRVFIVWCTKCISIHLCVCVCV